MACFLSSEQLLQWRTNQCTSYIWSGMASITQPRQLGIVMCDTYEESTYVWDYNSVIVSNRVCYRDMAIGIYIVALFFNKLI